MKKFKSIKALLTSGAGPGVSGIVNALKNHPFRDVQVVVGEVDDYECAGFMLADESCVLPRASATDYLEEMSRICREFGVDVIVPAFSGELDAPENSRSPFLKPPGGIRAAGEPGFSLFQITQNPLVKISPVPFRPQASLVPVKG